MPVNADLSWAIEDVRRRLPQYDLYRDYDEGRHRLVFATDKFRNTFGNLFREFADNLCDDIVDGITDRLQITSWSANDQDLNSQVDAIWDRNQGESRTGAIHRNGFREGDGFAIVQLDPLQRARQYRQRPEQMAVRYSTEYPDEMALAAKVWKAGKRYRANLYYPDRTEKYATRGVGADGGLPKAERFVLLTPGDPALQADEDSGVTETDGIPVFHYPNGELSEYGKSILRGVIPLQDALNKGIADMLVGMERVALPQRWATGVQVERDPLTGEEIDPFTSVVGNMYRTGAKDAQFGQFDAAEMDGFLDVQDSFKIEIARKGFLPPHTITLRGGNGTPPSGIALLVAEGRTIKLALDRHRDWGNEHRRMMAYSANLELGGHHVTAADLELGWTPPQTRDELALLETLALKRDLGVPDRVILLEMGYDADEVDEWLENAEDEALTQGTVMSILQGGRPAVSPSGAATLDNALGTPPVASAQ